MGLINPRSRYTAAEQVGMELQARIKDGRLPKDERIPSERELMAEFEIGRSTAREAVSWLRAAGLVDTKPGRGSYVL